ncbi:Holliday junction resolvase RuvX [Tomitella gaofuii]|uniref:Holliday junction resolvase RuvX n=1 Tax=Tomitella gaofuii TaxID=2760083 RepID=UPI001F017F33|nr:Holliday junction resolvase RuvX [Tomitella gaofuii]
MPAAAWRRGRRLAVDVGAVRIGVASCDPDGILATPVETVPRAKKSHAQSPDVRRIAALVDEYEAVEVIVGLPRTLRGTEGKATATVRAFTRVLEAAVAPVPVLFADERFSTVTAQQALHSSGVDTRRGRSVIDQAAAVAILQDWLERAKAATEGHPAEQRRAARSDGDETDDVEDGL